MNTFKRTPNEINTNLSSYSKIVKYYNQLDWRGLVENKNVFEVDQNSQADAKNVYVNSKGTLVSRRPLQEDKLSKELLPDNHKLVEVKQYGKVIIYVSQDIETNLYNIVATDNSTISLLDINPTKYNLSTIDNYIICFNDISAKVLDVNNISRGWFLLEQIAEIPVVVGEESEDFTNNNKFTNKYKRQFSFTNSTSPNLPIDGFNIESGIDMEIKTVNSTEKTNWHFSIVDNNVPEFAEVEFMAFKDIGYNFDANGEYDVCSGKSHPNILCIYKHETNNIEVSYNYGISFQSIPLLSSIGNAKIMSLSDDDYYLFVVSSNGVFYLDLSQLDNTVNYTWIPIYPWANSTNKLSTNSNFGIMYGFYHFLTKDIFTFITNDNYLWFMGPNLAGLPGPAGEIVTIGSIPNTRIGQLGCCKIPNCITSGPGKNRLNSSANKPATNDIYDPRLYYKNIHDIGIKIVKTNGYLITGATSPNFLYPNQTPGKDGTAVAEQNCTTIIINSLGDTPVSTGDFSWYVQNGLTTILLPATQCVRFVNNTVSPLSFHNKYYSGSTSKSYPSDFTIIANLGNDDDQNTTSNNIWTDDGFNFLDLIANAVNKTTINRITDSDYFTNYYQYNSHQLQSLRIDNIEHLQNFTLDRLITALEQVGVWQIKGSVLLEINYSYNWYTFTYEIGINHSNISQRLAFIKLENKLNLNVPSSNISSIYRNQILNAIAPYKVGLNKYFDIRSVFTVSKNGTDLNYNKLLKMPDEIWPNFKYLKSSSQYSNIVDLDPNIQILELQNGYIYFRLNDKLYTNNLANNDLGVLSYYYGTEGDNYTQVPDLSFENNNELYLAFNNILSITSNSKDDNGNTLLYLPPINDQRFINTITNIINISTTEVAIFFENKIIICQKVQDTNIASGFRYDYLSTKLSTGTRLGDSVINTIEGSYTIFPTKRGLAFMNYQAFMATTDQVLTYMTENIEERYTKFYEESNSIKIIQHRERLYLSNGTGYIFIYDLNRAQWWFWEVPVKITQMLTDQLELKIVADKLCVFRDNKIYKDFPLTKNAKRIEWFIVSQPLHLKAANYYKNLKQLIFHFLENPVQLDNKCSIKVQIQCYRKKLDTKEPEIIMFKVEELRTFVKRFNYWKINEVQYALGDDAETLTPTQLRLNGVSVKYEFGEEVR